MEDHICAYHAEMCKVFPHPKKPDLLNSLPDREMSVGEERAIVLRLTPSAQFASTSEPAANPAGRPLDGRAPQEVTGLEYHKLS